MNGSERRLFILKKLSADGKPISAASLAKDCGVSRQVIVGDVALLRVGGDNILATPRGYILEPSESASAAAERRIVCRHTDEHLLDELYTVVDLGGALIDVTVEHPIYGQIAAPLHIFSRFDADCFQKNILESSSKPLCELTDGLHLHTLRAKDTEAIERILDALSQKGFLFSENNHED